MPLNDIVLIAAMAQNRIIGAAGGLPWHLPNDLKRFKAMTMGKAVIFGRTTWEGIGRELPGRHVIVLSTTPGYQPPHGAHGVASVEEALALAARLVPGQPVMIAGGAKVYELFLPLATQIELTRINADYDGDTLFPLYNEAGWVVKAAEQHEGSPPFSYLTYRRQ
ncbi:MAG TPA: dihydrofolate reductase [Alphaproteobacteria bacterium]|nr:dihydrofolate reductase [Alphaproteobacteria bacterium]